ncbi:hypothetical protein [Streptomyces sp. NPDC088261]|uniref:hypothetical protein n=1 Tax=Streptomyces sp. NPDC088261 TaxID=3365851 RepID=UPI0037FF6609
MTTPPAPGPAAPPTGSRPATAHRGAYGARRRAGARGGPGSAPHADLGIRPHPADLSPSPPPRTIEEWTGGPAADRHPLPLIAVRDSDPVPRQEPDRPPWGAHCHPDTLTAGAPTSPLTRGRTGRHARVVAAKYTVDAPPVTVRRPSPLIDGGTVPRHRRAARRPADHPHPDRPEAP